MIRKANSNDLRRIIDITKACAKLMISKNIFQWNESYPSLETFKKDVINQSLYVIENNKNVDVFLHCWNTDKETQELLIKEYKPKKYIFENK